MNSPPGEPNQRLIEGPSRLTQTVAFGHEIDSYGDLWRWLSIADMAHVRALTTAGVIDHDLEVRLLKALVDFHYGEVPVLDPALGDLYSNRFSHLRASIGEIVDHIPTGRARREATTIAWHLETRTRIEGAIEAVSRLVAALLAVSRSQMKTLMPDFTYLQHAHPTTLGHYLLTFAYPLTRDSRRLVNALKSVNRSPAGSGSVNGSQIPFDREQLAAELEFDGLITHNRDAMWAPDIAFDPMWATMSALTTIDRLAEELQIWASSEFGYFEPADRHARSSVIMPQKKNPYGLALIRGHARDGLGRLVSVIATNLTPTGQPDNRVFAYGDVPMSLVKLHGVASLLAEHLEEGQFKVDALASSAGDGFTTATEVCDWMTLKHGVNNRDAHSIVGRAVRRATERGAHNLSVEDLSRAAFDNGHSLPDIDAEGLAALQDPKLIIQRRSGTGSVGDVRRMIEELEGQLNSLPASKFADFERRYLHSIGDIVAERNDA